MIPVADAWEITSHGEWLRRRQHLMTASRCAALVDAHPYLTREALAATFAGQGEGDNPAMRRGRMFEAACKVALKEDHPDWAVEDANTFHSIASLRIGCTPDGWATIDGKRVVIEIKTVSPEQWERWGARPPLHYTLQVLMSLIVCGLEEGRLCVMVMSPSYPVYEFTVARHPAAEKRLLDACAAWWDDYDAGRIAPAADAEGLAAMLDDGSVIDLSDNNYLCAMLPERQELKATISGAEKRVGEIEAAIKDAMGNASTAHVPGYVLSFKSQYRKEFITPARTIRVLRVTPAKETTK
jgi:predicted phage-related endonuclease